MIIEVYGTLYAAMFNDIFYNIYNLHYCDELEKAKDYKNIASVKRILEFKEGTLEEYKSALEKKLEEDLACKYPDFDRFIEIKIDMTNIECTYLKHNNPYSFEICIIIDSELESTIENIFKSCVFDDLFTKCPF